MPAKTRTKTSLFDSLFPLLFSLAIFASVLIWLKFDTNLPHWDMGRHLFHTLKYKELWLDFFAGKKNIVGLITMYMYYPPFVHNLGLLFSTVFGFRSDAAVYSNIVWVVMLSYSTYFLAKHFFDRKTAVCALLFLFASPLILGQIREFQVDFPLLAVFSLSFWLLIKTDNLKNSRYSFLFGLTFGLGMMVKWSYAFFGLPLAIIYALTVLIQHKNNLKILLKNTGWAIVGAFLICGPWYLRNFSALKSDFSQNGIRQAQVEGDPYGFNLAAYGWYAKMSSFYYLFLPLLAAFFLGLINIIKGWKNSKAPLFLIILLVVFYLVISTLPNKDIRYIMPAIVPVAIIGASAVNLFKPKIWPILFGSILVLVLILNNAVIFFGKHLPAGGQKMVLSKSQYIYTTIVDPAGGYTSNSPKEAVCPMDKIVASIPEGKTSREIGDSRIDFSDWAVAYYLTANNRIWAGQVDAPLKADYLISRNTNPNNPYLTDFTFASKLEMESSFPCTDQSTVDILKVRK